MTNKTYLEAKANFARIKQLENELQLTQELFNHCQKYVNVLEERIKQLLAERKCPPDDCPIKLTCKECWLKAAKEIACAKH